MPKHAAGARARRASRHAHSVQRNTTESRAAREEPTRPQLSKALPDDCLIDIFERLTVAERVAVGRVCRRWRALVLGTPQLWRTLRVPPCRPDVLAYLRGLLPYARHAKSLILGSRPWQTYPVGRASTVGAHSRATSDGSLGGGHSAATPPPGEAREYLGLVRALLQKAGPQLQHLRVAETDSSSVSSDLYRAVAANCPALEQIELYYYNGAGYVGDACLLLLTMHCPLVREFTDAQDDGLSERALNYICGWQHLEHLQINTERLSVATLFEHLGALRPSLRSLSVTDFSDPLGPQLAHLGSSLGAFRQLRELALDLRMTPHFDGLSPAQVGALLEAVPQLTKLWYLSASDSYFDAADAMSGDGTSESSGSDSSDSESIDGEPVLPWTGEFVPREPVDRDSGDRESSDSDSTSDSSDSTNDSSHGNGMSDAQNNTAPPNALAALLDEHMDEDSSDQDYDVAEHGPSDEFDEVTLLQLGGSAEALRAPAAQAQLRQLFRRRVVPADSLQYLEHLYGILHVCRERHVECRLVWQMLL